MGLQRARSHQGCASSQWWHSQGCPQGQESVVAFPGLFPRPGNNGGISGVLLAVPRFVSWLSPRPGISGDIPRVVSWLSPDPAVTGDIPGVLLAVPRPWWQRGWQAVGCHCCGDTRISIFYFSAEPKGPSRAEAINPNLWEFSEMLPGWGILCLPNLKQPQTSPQSHSWPG